MAEGYQPVKRIVVDAHLPAIMGGGVLVRWVPEERFPCALGPLTYVVLVGDSPSAEFKKLAEIQGDTQYMDTENRAFTRSLDVWYAIMTVDRNNKRYFSPPQRLGCVWEKREWLLAKEIVRQAMVNMKRRKAGTRGFLLRRRLTGDRCTECTDPDTGQVMDPNCATCYGTGIIGGYHPPIECYVQQQPERIVIRLDPQQGLLSEKTGAWNVLAYPPFSPNDFWVDANSGLRYRIQEQIATVAHIESIPVVQQLQVEAEDLDDIIYQFPVNCT